MTSRIRKMERTASARRHRLVGREDDGIALMSVILLIVVIGMLAVLMLGLVLAELRPTLYANKNTRTISASQAGIDAALSQIRNARTTDGSGSVVGDIHQLPCVVSGPVEDGSGATSFVAKVTYFADDPGDKDDAWRTANALTCYPGTGATGGLRKVPTHAVIESVGSDDSATVMADVANRSLEATYTFPLTTRTISGGQIMDSNYQYCLVAGSATVGSYIAFQPAEDARCKTPGDLNLWSWRSDYMIHLSSTDLDGRVPLCLSGRASNSTPVAMTLQECTLLTTDGLGQRFSWTGTHTWLGQNSDNTDYGSSYIVNADNNIGAGDRISVSTSTSNPKPVPLPAVGKGNASKATEQVVNQSQFGRCLDVTDTDISKAYMISYPCKQDPTGGGNFDWNHKWYYTEPDANLGQTSVKTTLRVTTGGTDYCLLTTDTQGIVAGGRPDGVNVGDYKPSMFPRFRTTSGGINCSGTGNSEWTRYADTGDVMTSWTFVDRNGRCLSANGDRVAGSNWNSIVVQTCDGKDYQKWNVPDDPIEASVGDFVETTAQRADG